MYMISGHLWITLDKYLEKYFQKSWYGVFQMGLNAFEGRRQSF